MNLKPLHDRVIVRRLSGETQRPSGIVIPDNATEKPDQGEVLAVGPGRTLNDGKIAAMSLFPGDRVLFGKYTGQSVKIGDDEVLVMREEEIFARFTTPVPSVASESK